MDSAVVDGPDDQENSELVWAFERIKDNNREDVDLYLRFASTACVPGGGCDIEQALDVLYKCKGDIMQATSYLLSRETSGQTIWTINEKHSFERAFSKCPKNFHTISKELKTKTVKDCVRYYYLWKKSLYRSSSTTPKIILNNCNGGTPTTNTTNNNNTTKNSPSNNPENSIIHQQVSYHSDQGTSALQPPSISQHQQYQSILVPLTPATNRTTLQLLAAIPSSTICTPSAPDSIQTPSSSVSDESRDSGRGESLLSLDDPFNQQMLHYPAKGNSQHQQQLDQQPQPEVVFPCKVCGREFLKIKSRSAHMKRHKNEKLG